MAEMTVGKTIRMPCMRRGLVAYPDETILVPQNALEAMSATAFGIPVTIEHPGQPIDSESLKEIKVVGRVAKFDYESNSDLWFADFVVDDDEAVKLLQSGWGVSTAWYANDYTNGGTYNNVPYDRELVSAKYEHLAIVRNPRYEMAVDPVFMNSKETDTRQPTDDISTITVNSHSNTLGGIKMFAKIWRTIREEVKANENEELVLELEHGQVPLSQIVEELKASRAAKTQEAAPEEEKMPMKKVLQNEDEVEVDGKKMRVQDLVAEYMESKKNAEMMCEKDPKESGMDEEEEKENKYNEEDEEEEKENEEDEEEEKLKPNARFNSLKSAYENGANVEIQDQFVSLHERVAMGRAAYGSKK